MKDAPRRKSWIYILFAMLLAVGFSYYSLINRSSASINHDFYRVLYEASNKFNENFNSLNSMHSTGESEVSIRSLLPSYSSIQEKEAKSEAVVETYSYELVGQKIQVMSNHQLDASIELKDLLPLTSDGFSQYLFANSKGKVVANTGGEKTISIVDMKNINQELLKSNNKFGVNFASKQDSSVKKQDAPLPTFSSHVDMQLSYGDFRVFVFPFSLSSPLKSSKNGKLELIDRLYLVGLLPKHQLNNKGSGHWNISLLVVSLISLLFMWALIRLFLLPENHSITRFYRILSQSSSYLFYIVLVSLILSYLTKSGLQSYKDQEAVKYARDISANLDHDLREIFNQVASYRNFYSEIVVRFGVLKPEPIAEESNDKPTWSYPKTVIAFNKALEVLAKDQYKLCKACNPQQPLPRIMASDSWDTQITTSYDKEPWTSFIETQNKRPSPHLKKYTQDRNKLTMVSLYAGQLEQAIDYGKKYTIHIFRKNYLVSLHQRVPKGGCKHIKHQKS
jgi:hypothetical protein